MVADFLIKVYLTEVLVFGYERGLNGVTLNEKSNSCMAG